MSLGRDDFPHRTDGETEALRGYITRLRSHKKQAVAPRDSNSAHLPLEPELSPTVPSTPEPEAAALVKRSQCQGCDVSWLVPERVHLALWQGTSRYSNHEPEGASTQVLQERGDGDRAQHYVL